MPTSTSCRGVRCPRQSGPTSSGRFRPPVPRLRRRKESRSRWLTDAARSRPRRPPPGTPQAVASSATTPDGSYVGVHATTSADRSNSGISASVACACTRSRSATPNRSARPRSLRASRSDCWSPRSASPMITNSAAGISRKARTNTSKPLSSNIFPTPTARCSPLRAACGPFGVNALPHVRLAESAGAQNVRATAVRNLDSPDSHSG